MVRRKCLSVTFVRILTVLLHHTIHSHIFINLCSDQTAKRNRLVPHTIYYCSNVLTVNLLEPEFYI